MRYSLTAVLSTMGICFSTACIAATQVNIADPDRANRAAHVEVGNRLAVQEVPPASYFHAPASVFGNTSCAVIATPPSGKALIVLQVRVNVYEGSGGGYVGLYADAGCTSDALVGEVETTAIGGPITVTFNPGIAIPSGGSLALANISGYLVDLYTDGDTVAAGVVPPVGGQTIQAHGRMPFQR